MSYLAEAMAVQNFGRDAAGNIKWPKTGETEAPVAAPAPAAPAPAPAPVASGPTATQTAAQSAIPEPPLTGRSTVGGTEIKKKTLLGQ